MANCYVDNTNGDDSTGDGSSGSPFKTIQHAFDNFSWSTAGGNAMYLANTSAFVLSSALTLPSGLTSYDSASNNNPFVMAGWDNGGSISITVPNGRTISPAFEIDGNDTVSIILTLSQTSGAYWAFVNGIFHSTTSHAIAGSGNEPARPDFINCEVYDTGGYYSVSDGGNYIGCYFHGTNNVAFNIGSYLAYGCWLEGFTDAGMFVITGSAINNVVKDCDAEGIRFGSDGGKIIHNTVDEITNASAIGIGSLGGSSFGLVLDNIVRNCDGASAYGYRFQGDTKVEIGNRSYNNTNDAYNGSYQSDNTTESADPFTNALGDDYTIDANADSYQSAHSDITPKTATNSGADPADAGGGGGETAHTYAS